MTTLLYPATLTPGSNENVNDLNSILNAIAAWANGNIDSTNLLDGGVSTADLAATLQQQLGTSGGATVGRGKSIIAATESRTNVAYGTLGTADQVASVVLPTDGLICVLYQAMWQESVVAASRAAIFLGANQVQTQQAAAGRGPVAQAAATSASGLANTDTPLFTGAGGLLSVTPGGAYGADVTTGQIQGFTTNSGTGVDNLAEELTGTFTYTGGRIAAGPCYIFAAAGTYTVSIQFKASSGSVTAKNRKLWVWSVGF